MDGLRAFAAVVTAVLVAAGGAPSDREGASVQLVSLSEPAFTSPAQAAAPALSLWCGGDAGPADRKPDLEVSSDRQVHVLYVVPAGEPDRFAELAPGIATDVGAIDNWWQAQDALRRPRWDLFAFPGCTSRAGMLDIGFARLPNDASYYADSRVTDRLVAELRSMAAPAQKTLVYYDGPRSARDICGTSNIAPAYAGPLGFSFVWLRSSCAGELGSGGAAAVTAAHELTHSLGGVQLEGPPNRCLDPSRIGHVCDDRGDLMFPYQTGLSLVRTILDVGRDDYYGHPDRWWDVQDSLWLTHLPQRALTVSVADEGGSGAITAEPGITECRATRCTATLDDRLRVRLRAIPDAGSRLWSWRGACTGWNECAITMRDSAAVTATFGPERYRLDVHIAGRGRVRSLPPGISCTRACGAWFAPGKAVRLRAAAGPGWRFAGWTGACHGPALCTVVATADRGVGVVFVRR